MKGSTDLISPNLSDHPLEQAVLVESIAALAEDAPNHSDLEYLTKEDLFLLFQIKHYYKELCDLNASRGEKGYKMPSLTVFVRAVIFDEINRTYTTKKMKSWVAGCHQMELDFGYPERED